MEDSERTDGGREPGAMSFDMALELVSQYQRRAILRFVTESEASSFPLEALIDHLVDIERERNGDVPGEDFILSVLVHVHGPKLEESGLIDYDIPDQQVEYHSNEEFEAFLTQILELEERW